MHSSLSETDAFTQGNGAVLCVIGAGPRGTALLERLASSFHELYPADGDLTVVVVDPCPPGAGRVWQPDQPYELVMNTFAGEVTLFTDETVICDGPVVHGPNMYQWCSLIAGREPEQILSPGAREAFGQWPVSPKVLNDRRLMDEMAQLQPWSHPSRILYGAYLSWCFERAVGTAPNRISITCLEETAVDVRPHQDGGYLVFLSSGTVVACDVMVMSPGWLATGPTGRDLALVSDLEKSQLTWIPPGSPMEQNVSQLAPGQQVIVRGLGMGFFDAMALLTLERGGRFEPVPGSSRLRYIPSGLEPRLIAGSRRGVPYRSKPRYDALPPASDLRYLKGARLGERTGQLDFENDVYPLILKDAVDAYYRTLARAEPREFSADPERLLGLVADEDPLSASWGQAVSRFVPDPAKRLDLRELIDPANRTFESPDEFTGWVRDYLIVDLDEGRRGRNSALKAAAWSIGSARGPVVKLAAFHGLSGGSYAKYQEFMALGGMLGSGPPAFRSEQLLALMDAGIVTLVGPEMRLTMDHETSRLMVTSDSVAGARVAGEALLDAWMHLPSVSRSSDPLTTSLREQAMIRGYCVRDPDGSGYPTESFEITAQSHLVRADGHPNPGLYMVGIPAEGVGPATLASPLPGTNSEFLREIDAVARRALHELCHRKNAGRSSCRQPLAFAESRER